MDATEFVHKNLLCCWNPQIVMEAKKYLRNGEYDTRDIHCLKWLRLMAAYEIPNPGEPLLQMYDSKH